MESGWRTDARNGEDAVGAAVTGQLLQVQAAATISGSRSNCSAVICPEMGASPRIIHTQSALEPAARKFGRESTNCAACPSEERSPRKFPSISLPIFRLATRKLACATGARSGPLPRRLKSS